jgi:hypothetical protein
MYVLLLLHTYDSSAAGRVKSRHVRCWSAFDSAVITHATKAAQPALAKEAMPLYICM